MFQQMQYLTNLKMQVSQCSELAVNYKPGLEVLVLGIMSSGLVGWILPCDFTFFTGTVWNISKQ